MRAKALLTRLLFPPKCAACGTLMPPDTRDTVLCSGCRRSYEKALLFECRECNLPLYYCNCMPSPMQRAKVTAHVKAAAFGQGERFRAVRGLVLYCKRRRRKQVFSFLAKELTLGVKEALKRSDRHYTEEGKPAPPPVLGYLPRSRGAYRKYGFDQAKELAVALSEQLDLPLCSVLKRVGGKTEQKMLDANERRVNLAHAFSALEVKGLRVLLVDDVVTTGFGMSAAARALYRAGAAEVLAVSFALTPKEK